MPIAILHRKLELNKGEQQPRVVDTRNQTALEHPPRVKHGGQLCRGGLDVRLKVRWIGEDNGKRRKGHLVEAIIVVVAVVAQEAQQSEEEMQQERRLWVGCDIITSGDNDRIDILWSEWKREWRQCGGGCINEDSG